MLTIRDSSGNDLLDNPPADLRLNAIGDERVSVNIEAQIVEDDTDLPFAYVNGTLDWGDGSQPTVYLRQSGTLTIDESKLLGSGDYVVQLRGQNFLAPTPDVVTANFGIQIVRADDPAPTTPVLYGPIIPRDAGEPNSNSWFFDSRHGLAVLEASVKMLLTTAKGERIMEPDYGTSLRRLLFEPNTSALHTVVEQEIAAALNRWEPRVKLQAITIVRDSERSVSVQASFLSLLESRSFEIDAPFVR